MLGELLGIGVRRDALRKVTHAVAQEVDEDAVLTLNAEFAIGPLPVSPERPLMAARRRRAWRPRRKVRRVERIVAHSWSASHT